LGGALFRIAQVAMNLLVWFEEELLKLQALKVVILTVAGSSKWSAPDMFPNSCPVSLPFLQFNPEFRKPQRDFEENSRLTNCVASQ
jgi:hypothetical protein